MYFAGHLVLVSKIFSITLAPGSLVTIAIVAKLLIGIVFKDDLVEAVMTIVLICSDVAIAISQCCHFNIGGVGRLPVDTRIRDAITGGHFGGA